MILRELAGNDQLHGSEVASPAFSSFGKEFSNCSASFDQ